MNRYSLLILSILIFISFTPLSAQNELKKADKQLDLRAYDLAIQNYKLHLDKNPDDKYAQLQLAKAYQTTNNLIKSMFWYEKALDNNITHKTQNEVYQFATILKKLGLYEKAKLWFNNYKNFDPEVATNELKGCEQAIKILSSESEYDLELFDANSKQSDFGASVLGDQLIFNSFRKDISNTQEKTNKSYLQNVGSQLYITPNKEEISEKDLQLFSSAEELFGIGSVSFSKDMKKIALTKNNFSNGVVVPHTHESNLGIFLAKTDQEGRIGEEVAFPFNELDYSYAFPHLTFNGSALYFASNRRGGYGGFDIYVSYLKNGNWSQPKNLGSKINSAYDEITPFLDDATLYFASDNPTGIGGFDNFKSTVIDGQWQESVNLGNGINSPGDDYYLIVNNDQYILTSNRLGGKGGDDIYIAKSINQDEEYVPEPVNLEELAYAKTEKNIENTSPPSEQNETYTEVSNEESIKIDYAKKEESSSIKGDLNNNEEFKMYDANELKLTGATKDFTSGSMSNHNRYFIQLASLSSTKGELNQFENLTQYGSIYRFYIGNVIKIRLGSFETKIDADIALAKIRQRGYSDAFITSAILDKFKYETLFKNEQVEFTPALSSNSQSEYKVRLASYTNPLTFNTNELQYLNGNLEQWTKGKWTIFILSGFGSLEEAQLTRIKAINRGFTQAHVVIDDNGILKKLVQN